MHRASIVNFAILASVAFVFDTSAASATPAATDARPNVLFIAVDDLRPELGCYGARHIQSPNIDRLAASGVRFDFAYCQQAVCNPSRTSLMTGLRPDTIGVTGNHLHFRSNRPDAVTLPQHFKQHGYHAAAIGKLYHGVFPDGASKTKWDTMGDPQSWSVPAIRFGPRYYYTEDGIAAAKEAFARSYKTRNADSDAWMKKLVFGPATESPDVADNVLYDGQVADSAVAALRDLKQRPDQPFFLAVGFIKPHSPYIAPQKYFDLYDDVDIASDQVLPQGAPGFSGHDSGELRRYTDQSQHGDISEDQQRRVRQAYYACVSYVDAQIGRVLDELDRLGLSDNTIVSLYGDHGYHLGEHGLWGKTTNFELDTRVPLIIRAPGTKAAGQPSSAIVELVDLYPTLADLAGLPVGDHLQGTSLSALLDDLTQNVKEAAFSQYPRGELMGYSMRTPTHRLTRWTSQKTGEVKVTELYDYVEGPLEQQNIAAEQPDVVQKLNRLFVALQPPAQNPTVVAKASNSTSFESQSTGTFKTLTTEVGTWTTVTGDALIDGQHATTGRQCLHLPGGNKTVVELQVADGLETTGNLSFKAERWTKRAPFSFRIEKRSGGKWTEIYNGDKQVRVGRPFLSTVEVALDDAKIDRLRLTVVSPPNTGILIDDLRIAPAAPQKITSVEIVPMALPALIGADRSPLLKLKVEATGRLNPISLTGFRCGISGFGNAESISFHFGQSETFSNARQIAQPGDQGPPNLAYQFNTTLDSCALSEGSNYFWVACRVAESANIDRRVGAAARSVLFSDGSKRYLDGAASIQNLGVSVRDGGDDGVHTYRIPGLATTKQGSLIAVYDVRRRSGGDLPGDIDVGMSRSTDGGRTWQPMQVIMDMGDDPDFRYDGIGDPTVLVDKNTGTVWCGATWSHGNRSWVGSQPGLDPADTGQFMLVKSDDDGVTWSPPINITKQVKKPEWSFLLQGPGKGITLSDGTIVMPAQYQDPPSANDRQANRLPHSAFVFSRDHGETWDVSTGAYDDTTEAQVVELADGEIMLNCRYNRESKRVVMTTSDLGQTWVAHSTNRKSLIEPGACMASVINVGRELRQLGIDHEYAARNDILLFSNPDSLRGRNHITIKASLDGGQTWPDDHHLLLDEGGGRGYSCMTMIDADTVGIIYEGSRAHMTFQRVKLADILTPPKNQKTKNPAQVSKAVSAATGAASPVAFSTAFGDHMVLQAQQPIRIWGQATPGQAVTVKLGTTTATAKAGRKGRWQVTLPVQQYNRIPQTLSATSENVTAAIQDVLIGEVWLCAGQSNMEWPLDKSTGGKQAIAKAADDQLRLMNYVGAARGAAGVYAAEMMDRMTADRFGRGTWAVAESSSSAKFSAVGYYFAKQLRDKLDCPVGVINVAIGGTPIEAWIDAKTLAEHATLSNMVDGNWLDNPNLDQWCKTRARSNLKRALAGEFQVPGDEFGPNHSFKPGFMYQAGVRPFTPMSIRGVLWYQGESNGDNAARTIQYDAAFPLLVSSWRDAFQNNDMPVAFVQLPAMGRANWPVFREYQRRSLSQLSNVGMAVTIDTGDRTNVHPAAKQPVGQRLAQWALATNYGQPGPAMGPLYRSQACDGNALVLAFDTDGDRLMTVDGAAPNNFEIAGTDGKFYPATATISGSAVRVSSDRVDAPQHARYAYSDFPEPRPNLFNSSGLPASPFTTTDAIVDDDVKPPDDRPNILFIVSEDNSEHLGCYGEHRVLTPNLDALAETGVRYTRAYVPYSVCSPSRSAFLTGLYTRQTGHIGLATHNFSMYRDFKTMPAYFQQAGYYTGFLGKTHVNPERLVEDHVNHRAIANSNFSKTISIETYAEEAAAVMQKAADRDKPFLLIINYADAHRKFVRKSKAGFPTQLVTEDIAPFPWIGSDSPGLRQELKDYFNCMNRLDEGVGMVLKKLDEASARDNTLMVYISDHGADFPRGKGSIYENGNRIPMIVNHSASFNTGKVEDGMVSTIDILPTMLKAAKIPVPGHLPGIALQDIDSGKVPPRSHIHTFTTGSSPNLLYMQFGIRDERYKLVYSPDRTLNRLGESRYKNSRLPADQHVQSFLYPPEYELFDLRQDPHEWNNLADSAGHQNVRQRLLQTMQEFQHRIKDPFVSIENVATFIAEQKSHLHKPYKKAGFRWPHLGMFEHAQATTGAGASTASPE